MSLIPEITFPLDDPVLMFALLMALIFLAPQLVKQFKIPGLVGLIIGGALVGPSVFNLIEHDPDAVPPDFIGVMGIAGLMYLMFQAGLSLDLGRFNQLKGRSIGFGLISFFIPQTMAVAGSYFYLGFSWEASLLLGAIIGSHTLIAYPIVAQMRLLKNTAVTMSLGGTLVTDTLSLSILAVVVASLSGNTTVGFWTIFFVMVAAFVLLVLWGLPLLGYWFFRTVRNRPELEFGFLLTVLFVTAWLADVVGLAPIIGAFVAGIAMNRLVPGQGTVMARVRFIGQALFIPFFLIYVGLLIDVRALFESLDVWKLALLLIATVTIGKLIAAKLSQYIFGYTAAEGWVIYGLTVPQAAATLAVTLVGYDVGLFDMELVNAVVIMILVSCLLGSALVEKFGLEVAHAEEFEPKDHQELPERILVPVANPETSNELLEMAFLMRDPDSTEPIYPLMIVPDDSQSEDRVHEKQDKMGYAVERGAEADVPVSTLTRIDMNVARGVARAAQEEQATLIIIGWSGQVTARERIFGTVLDQLLEESRQMVFVNRLLHPLNTTQKVVLTIPPFAERSPGFQEAIRDIKLMSSRLDAKLEVLCVEEYLDQDKKYVDRIKPEMETKFESAKDWSQMPQTLDGMVTESTMVVALSARPKTAPWFADLDELPRMLVSRYPENSFSVVFLSNH